MTSRLGIGQETQTWSVSIPSPQALGFVPVMGLCPITHTNKGPQIASILLGLRAGKPCNRGERRGIVSQEYEGVSSINRRGRSAVG